MDMRADGLEVGSELYVPVLPYSLALSPLIATVDGLAPIGCTAPNIQITSPIMGQHVRRVFRLFGTAVTADFAAYRVEVRPDFASYYDVFFESRQPVVNGELARVDSDAYGKGLHWVRVSVVNSAGEIVSVPCAIPLFFD
jgi:hypothetical protein